MIRFYINDELISLAHARADLTVLNYLRDHRAMVGTKEGCASGDCGACTVAVAELNAEQNALHYRTLNSCVTFMSALHGKQLITVEHLATGDKLHPVQQALVDNHASQCGYCTPGFVMSMFGLYQNTTAVTRQEVLTALSGNLCRCTGYRPIIDATLDACNQPRQDKFTEATQQKVEQLKALSHEQQATNDNLIMPTTRAQLAEAIRQHPNARLVAGSTDLALEFTQQLQLLDTLISVSQVKTLRRVEILDNTLTIGAACPLNDIQPILIKHFPELFEVIDRFASLPIRNQATLGGNIANASPIGDMPPVCIALNAKVSLDNGKRVRQVPLCEFFIDYRKTQLQPDEWVDAIIIPLSEKADAYLRAYKISKRFEDDISAVCAVFNLQLDNGKVATLSTGFGGVAATPASCDALKQALVGKVWANKDCVALGQAALRDAFSPIDDVRASAEYRHDVLANLWYRFWLETNAASQAIQTRVVTHA